MKLRHATAGDKSLDFLVILFFSLFTLLCIFPFYYLIINTLSDNTLVARGQILFFPKGLHFDNYAQVFRINGLDPRVRILLVQELMLGQFQPADDVLHAGRAFFGA